MAHIFHRLKIHLLTIEFWKLFVVITANIPMFRSLVYLVAVKCNSRHSQHFTEFIFLGVNNSAITVSQNHINTFWYDRNHGCKILYGHLWLWPYLQFHLAIDPVTFGHRSSHSWPKSAKSGHSWSFGHTYKTLILHPWWTL